MSETPLASFKNVNHYYGEGSLRKQILFDISVDFHPGEITILTGPSGSGKTTLLTLAGALRSVQEGSAQVLGLELRGATKKAMGEIRKKIGFIFQAHNLIDALSARQNVQMSLQLHDDIDRSLSEERADTMLQAVGLGERIHHLPSELSGGQKQRVAIARALIAKPTLILADEPTAALDKTSGREVVTLLQQLAREQGTAIIMVTHDNRILDVADRILTLEDGRIITFTEGAKSSTHNVLSAVSHLNSKSPLSRMLEEETQLNEFENVLTEATSEVESLVELLDRDKARVASTMIDQVLETASALVTRLLKADRASIFLTDHEQQELRSRVALQSDEIVIPFANGGLAVSVATSGKPINVPDASMEPRFNPEHDRRTGYVTRNVLSMPVFSQDGNTVIAVTQLINKKGEQPFNQEDEAVFGRFGEVLSKLLESCAQLSKAPSGATATKP